MGKKIMVGVNIDTELLEKIDTVVVKKRNKYKNRTFNRSAWICEALEKQVKNELGFSFYRKQKAE